MTMRHYLTAEQIEDRIGAARGSLSDGDLPPVDAVVGPVNDDGTLPTGSIRIWLVSTIDTWQTGVKAAQRVHQVYRADHATKELLSAYDLEMITGIPSGTWRYWVTVDQAPPSQKIGRRRLYPRVTTMEWLRDKGIKLDVNE